MNMNLRCLVVDDEPMARGVIETYCAKLDFLEHVFSCKNALEALSFLQENEIDLVFLDINMPEITGLDFLKLLSNPPLVVFTTAYSEYAVDSYTFEVLDYLLKPISFQRFLIAANRAFRIVNKEKLTTSVKEDVYPKQDYFVINQDRENYKVPIKDILYIKSFGNYVKIFTKKKMYLPQMTLKKVEEVLSTSSFLRIHRTTIVAIDKIESFDKKSITIQKENLSVGLYYRKQVQEKLSSL